MRFPGLNQLQLQATLSSVTPGRLHRDGTRYLPVLGFELQDGTILGVVDRHHVVDQQLIGSKGTLRLVCLLSRITVQKPPYQQGVVAPASQPSLTLTPVIYGQITCIPTWECTHQLGYTQLYTELHLELGLGSVGVRTTLTAPVLQDALGADRLEPAMWLEVTRSRIDVLAFTRSTHDHET